MRRAATACVVFLVLGASPWATAHGPADPRVRYATPILEPAATGVTGQITPPVLPHLSPQVRVDNKTRNELTLQGESGEPFLRIGPQGTFGNIRSPFLGPALNPNDRSPPPRGPAPSWKRLSAGPAFRWYERRAAYGGHQPANADAPAVLQTWIVPGTIGGTPVRLTGRIEWKPLLGSIVPAIVKISPPDDAIEVRVLPGPIPAIQLRNSSARTIQIEGRDGRPFARIGPQGVQINVNSPTHRDTRSLPDATSTTVDFQAQPGQTLLVWLERRAAYEGEPPAAVQRGATPAVLKRWIIPGTIDGSPFEIRGATQWIPRRHGSPVRTGPSGVWFIVTPVVGGLAALAIGIWLARARPRS